MAEQTNDLPITLAPKQTQPRRGYRRRTVSHDTNASSLRKRREHRLSTPLRVSFLIPRSLPVSWVLSTATTVLVDHLLYARGLIPLSIGQLNQQYESNSWKSPNARRKVSQCHQQLRALKDSWKAVVENSFFKKCSFILLSIGPSFSRAREFFIIDTGGVETFVVDENVVKLPSPHALARRLLPKVMECDLALPSRSASAYQIWVSIFIRPETLEKIWAKEETNQSLQNWIPRPGFRFSSKQVNKPNNQVVHIQLSNNNQDDANFKLPEDSNGHWLSLPTSIKGFRI